MYARKRFFGAAGLVCTGLMLGAAWPVYAENLIEVYHRALMNDPRINAATYEHAAAGDSKREALGRMLPQLSAEYSRSETDYEILRSSNPFQPEGNDKFPTTEYALSLSQPIFNWGLYKGYKQAQSNLQRADADLQGQQQDLILRTAQRYLEALASIDEVELANAEKNAVGKQLELVQSMMRSGMARKTELYDVKARYASVEADVISANSFYDDKLQALREMVGEVSADLARLREDISLVYPEPRDPQSWMKAAVQQNPRVIAQEKAVSFSQQDVSIQKSAHMPSVELVARMSNRDSEGSNISSDSEVESKELLLRLTVPLYSGGITSSRVSRSHNLYMKARSELTEVRRAAERAARSAYHGIISAISKVNALAESVKSQNLALQAKQQGYRAGLYTSLDILDAQRDVYAAKRDYARARYDYLLNSLSLKHAVGTLNEVDIEGINQFLVSADKAVQ